MKQKVNWWEVLNALLHVVTLGLAKLQTIVAEKAKEKKEQ